ncbi:hypothetical protein SSGZ1_1584 [Streptococcus suis GZ1]|uniref:Heptaprenyl diphosphate synthase n=3 Tax=Streptococcus suis TaxID=1307 RepID=D5AJM5_STRGZ|nr:hypothetical protein SSGZ1_1584 [Streptococcus suis GZ1]
MNSKRQTLNFITMLAAQAVVISLIERLITPPFAFAPGAKLGLGNLISLIAIFTLPTKDSLKVVALRLLISTFLGGTFSTFLYGLAGTTLSYVGNALCQAARSKPCQSYWNFYFGRDVAQSWSASCFCYHRPFFLCTELPANPRFYRNFIRLIGRTGCYLPPPKGRTFTSLSSTSLSRMEINLPRSTKEILFMVRTTFSLSIIIPP